MRTAVEGLSEWRRRVLDAASPTYAELGASLDELPPGYAHLDRARLIGHGTARFDSAAEGVLGWRLQTGAGLRVRADGPARTGAVVELGFGLGPARIWSPCRVVAVLDEPGRRGFAYGTLPGHPESGEEAFLVTRDDHDQVWLRIRAFSRPGTPWSRALAPAVRLVQAGATRGYLHALD